MQNINIDRDIFLFELTELLIDSYEIHCFPRTSVRMCDPLSFLFVKKSGLF